MLARRRKRKKEEEAKAKIAEEEAAMPRHKLTFKAAATAVIVQHKLRKRVLFGYNLDIFDQLPRLVKLPSRSTSERLTTRTPSEPIHRGLGKLFGGGGSGGGDRPTGGVASRPPTVAPMLNNSSSSIDSAKKLAASFPRGSRRRSGSGAIFSRDTERFAKEADRNRTVSAMDLGGVVDGQVLDEVRVQPSAFAMHSSRLRESTPTLTLSLPLDPHSYPQGGDDLDSDVEINNPDMAGVSSRENSPSVSSRNIPSRNVSADISAPLLMLSESTRRSPPPDTKDASSSAWDSSPPDTSRSSSPLAPAAKKSKARGKGKGKKTYAGFQIGDRVRVLKDGNQKGAEAIVSDPEWNGERTSQMQSSMRAVVQSPKGLL
jgi:hypothetical protein